MKLLLVYATNSGSCFLVAERIVEILKVKHQVTVQLSARTTPNDLDGFNAIILGTPSWSVEGQEGYPHETMLKLIRTCAGRNFSTKRFALYGCGDNSYTFFCGAVDHLENFVSAAHGQNILEPLRIDSYYFDLKNNNKLVDEWAEKVMRLLHA